MNSQDHIPERPSDIIDFVENLCGEKGKVAEVSQEYYDGFLALSKAEMEILAHAVLNAQAKEARRLTFAEPATEAPTRLLDFASNTLFAIAIGICPLRRLRPAWSVQTRRPRTRTGCSRCFAQKNRRRPPCYSNDRARFHAAAT